WNFVFGQASVRERVGVYSFARYDPAFYGEARPPGYETLLLRRSCKVLAHETSHMFGLAHCTFFNCLMNGSNHLAESDRRPLHLCPVCLRKLQWSIEFDVLERYRSLERVARTDGFIEEADWLNQRIKILRGDQGDQFPSAHFSVTAVVITGKSALRKIKASRLHSVRKCPPVKPGSSGICEDGEERPTGLRDHALVPDVFNRVCVGSLGPLRRPPDDPAGPQSSALPV